MDVLIFSVKRDLGILYFMTAVYHTASVLERVDYIWGDEDPILTSFFLAAWLSENWEEGLPKSRF